MDLVYPFLTNQSKLNLNQINITKNNANINPFLKDSFLEYKKFFINTNTEIYVKDIDKNIVKNRLLEFYQELIDDKADESYNFIKSLDFVNKAYEMTVKGHEMFKFFVYYDDLDYISKILHLFDIFTNFIFNVPEKKKLVQDRILKSYGIMSNENIDKYTFNIYIYPNNIPRKLADKIYSCDHLKTYKTTNTAFTTSGVTGFDMVLTKKEELSKLLLHELIHLFKLDGTFKKITNILNNTREQMPFQDECGEMECIAESLSNIFNCMNVTLIVSKANNLNEQQELNLLNMLIHIEKEYSIFIVSKILKYFNIDPMTLFDYNNKKIELVSPINLYYIFRSVIFFDFDLFFQENNINMINKNILEINDNIYKQLKKYIYNNIKPYKNKLLKIYNSFEIQSNLSTSYIILDIDFDKVKLNNIIIRNEKNINQNGGYKNIYYQKYIKYKLKYINLSSNYF